MALDALRLPPPVIRTRPRPGKLSPWKSAS